MTQPGQPYSVPTAVASDSCLAFSTTAVYLSFGNYFLISCFLWLRSAESMNNPKRRHIALSSAVSYLPSDVLFHQQLWFLLERKPATQFGNDANHMPEKKGLQFFPRRQCTVQLWFRTKCPEPCRGTTCLRHSGPQGLRMLGISPLQVLKSKLKIWSFWSVDLPLLCVAFRNKAYWKQLTT